MYIGQSESSKYRLSVLNDLINRGVKGILIFCTDGLAGIKYFSHENKKELAKDLKTIYHAPNERTGHERMLKIMYEGKI